MKRLFLLLAVACMATISFSGVPGLMNYQGLLTDQNGIPLLNANRSVEFRIYDAPAAGNTVWGPETHSVTTDGSGRFNVIFGQGTVPVPITDGVFSGTDRWLGIKVGTDAELSPRTRITSAAYANRVATVDGATGGTITGNVTLQSTLTTDSLRVGDPITRGYIEIENGNGSVGSYLWAEPSIGGYMNLNDTLGDPVAVMGPNSGVVGGGATLILYRDDYWTSSEGVQLRGRTLAGQQPQIRLNGSSRDATFDMANSSNSSVVLPDSAISAPEILDEPGIAANNSGGSVTLTGSVTDVVTVSMTIPAAGYVVVEGKCYFILSGTTGGNYGHVQIDTAAGGSMVSPYYTEAGADEFGSTGLYYFPGYVTRTYSLSAGTYTFRMEGQHGGAGTAVSSRNMINATYYPTSYGSVITAVTASEASQFEQATPIPPQETSGMTASVSSEQMYQVDLRELELKAEKERAEAEKARAEADEAEMELLNAQLKAQMQKMKELQNQTEQKQ